MPYNRFFQPGMVPSESVLATVIRMLKNHLSTLSVHLGKGTAPETLATLHANFVRRLEGEAEGTTIDELVDMLRKLDISDANNFDPVYAFMGIEKPVDVTVNRRVAALATLRTLGRHSSRDSEDGNQHGDTRAEPPAPSHAWDTGGPQIKTVEIRRLASSVRCPNPECDELHPWENTEGGHVKCTCGERFVVRRRDRPQPATIK